MTRTDLPLGRPVDYPRHYDAGLLFPIPRSEGRAVLGLAKAPCPSPATTAGTPTNCPGWTRRGKPLVATATFVVPADSPNLVESKSLKLYLNSFNATRFDSRDAVRARIAADLSAAAGAAVDVQLGLPPVDAAAAGVSIDAQDVAIDHYGPPQAGFLSAGGATSSRKPCPANCSSPTARSPGNPTGPTCASPTAGRASTGRACCATWCRSGTTASSTNSASSGSSWTCWRAARLRAFRCRRATRAGAAWTSIRGAPRRACRPRPGRHPRQ